MSETVIFAFKMLQKVCIPAIKQDGFIVSRLNNQQGCNEYKVIHWRDSLRTESWVFEQELESRK